MSTTLLEAAPERINRHAGQISTNLTKPLKR